MTPAPPTGLHARAAEQFPHWEVAKDVTDQFIDLMLNYRQSGHPGGSRSKVHAFLSLVLSGAMRWTSAAPTSRSTTGSC